MDSKLASRTQIKLFLGFLLKQELKAILYQKGTDNSFVTIPYQGEHYIGRYLEGELHALDVVKIQAMALLDAFHKHYPESKGVNLSFHIFPELFIR